MSACPSLHFSLRSVRCFAVFPATGTGFRYTPRLQSRGVAEVERRFEAGAVKPLVPSSGTAAFLFADASSPAACAPWASRAVRVFYARFLQDATSKEPIEI
ncbi:MAG: hypothetical protein QOD67_5120 [Caballeronia sp.]|jgi:hypothetical protein|nr:hypothetical protein [Caballeronia sp.]